MPVWWNKPLGATEVVSVFIFSRIGKRFHLLPFFPG